MIEQAVNIIKAANATQMQLNIRVDGDKVTVVVNTMLSPTVSGESPDALKLRAALTQPIVICGDVGEVDVSITDALVQYIDTYAPAAKAHSNLLDVKVKTEKALKVKPKVKTTVKASVEAETPTPVKPSISTETPVVESVKPKEVDFFSDDADSL